MMTVVLGLTLFAASAVAADVMPADEQNALIGKYCTVCHSDAVRNGGLSLQRFDVSKAPPSLAAMLVAKLNSGAFGAAGIRPPGEPTEGQLQTALSLAAAGATAWSFENGPVASASTLRQVAAPQKPGHSSLYRLLLTCDNQSKQGEIQLAWAPIPARGTLSASVDGAALISYPVEGTEHMGNGNPITSGPASLRLRSTLPRRSLRLENLFPGETVEFSFSDLPPAARSSLNACFTEP